MDLTEEDVHRIIRIIDTLEYGDIELEYGDLKISVQRGNAPPANDIPPRPSLRQQAPSAATRSGNIAEPPRPSPAGDGYHEVRSPVNGIFFSAPSPGAPPFVDIGSIVEPDDPVCLIEIMKLFNSVPAGIRGRIVEVCVANGQPVQREQVLIRIGPASE